MTVWEKDAAQHVQEMKDLQCMRFMVRSGGWEGVNEDLKAECIRLDRWVLLF